jgi:hypothetical protein
MVKDTDEDDRLHEWNINLPFSKPLGTIGGTRDGSTDFHIKASPFEYVN